MSDKKKVGRKPIQNSYIEVTYNNKQYIVGSVPSKKGTVKFVFDKDYEEKVKSLNWCVTSTGYIGSCGYSTEEKKSLLLLHRLIMNVPYFPGKGAKETVDHINRNPLDNRKENLRILNQTDQNINQRKKSRKVILPEGCGLTPEDLPRHIWYSKPNGSHGERFVIELKTENFIWKSTASTSISIHTKLAEAKQKLLELYDIYPYLNPNNETRITEDIELNTSYSEIISLSK